MASMHLIDPKERPTKRLHVAYTCLNNTAQDENNTVLNNAVTILLKILTVKRFDFRPYISKYRPTFLGELLLRQSNVYYKLSVWVICIDTL